MAKPEVQWSGVQERFKENPGFFCNTKSQSLLKITQGKPSWQFYIVLFIKYYKV